MSIIKAELKNDLIFFDQEKNILNANKYKTQYKKNTPFPHIVFDDFMPSQIIERLIKEFPTAENLEIEYSRKRESQKRLFNPEGLSSTYIRSLFHSLNSQPFLSFLEDLTGIDGLLPDPYFLGGGLHETKSGGYLGIHADFNVHEKLRLKRRINLLIYLNKEWQGTYGGNLELWDTKMTAKQKDIPPTFNRAVIFNTDSNSFHGHPEPLNTPSNISRRSLALYYYTASDRLLYETKRHTTVFKARKGTNDAKGDFFHRMMETIRDFIPPAVSRLIKRIRK